MVSERTEQVAVRLPTSLLATVDDLVSVGVYPSRAALARAGIEELAAKERARLLDAEIAEGYRRFPQTDGDMRSAVASLRDAILEEPW